MADLKVAMDRLRELYPTGSLSIDVEYWAYSSGDRELRWRAWLDGKADPGSGGRHIEGFSLDDIMAKAESEAAAAVLAPDLILDVPTDDPVPVTVADSNNTVSF